MEALVCVRLAEETRVFAGGSRVLERNLGENVCASYFEFRTVSMSSKNSSTHRIGSEKKPNTAYARTWPERVPKRCVRSVRMSVPGCRAPRTFPQTGRKTCAAYGQTGQMRPSATSYDGSEKLPVGVGFSQAWHTRLR